jgi:hypothetical protein
MDEPLAKTKIKIELTDEAVRVLNEIAGEWRNERHSLKIGVGTVAAEFVMAHLQTQPQWKNRVTESRKKATRSGATRKAQSA